ncbi:MAG TPA: nitroreductase family deazaflavin-dependent oxidoreductase [Candidatus Limnocylindrales bacterium]|nr:nitroreductase family deazaflavin-dependent oxidoreductase [Candidatus Limnocylindrales bacterium]
MILDDGARGRDVCDLETIGRTSGQPRVIEIWFAADADRLYLLSGGRDDAHWVRNLQQEPRVRVRIGRRWYTGTARTIEGEPDEQHAREMLAAKYQGWSAGRRLSGWARESLPVAIDLSQ